MKQLRLCIAFVCLALVAMCDRAIGQPASPPTHASGPAVKAVASVALTVSNLDRSVRFFEEVLAFEQVVPAEQSDDAFLRAQGLASASTRIAVMQLGDERIELIEFVAPKGRPMPADSRSNDRWFQHIAIIVSDMDRAHQRIHENMVKHASKDPQRLPDWNKNAAGIKAFYFRDPDGHFLEVLEFPSDKGDAKWHRKADRLFLGIDHTAIVVGDTDKSLTFYRDALGMKVVGSSENYGPEQEALNNVPGAHLKITTLRASAGPGIELLEYLRPRDGRPYPADARPNDTLYWRTILVGRPAEPAITLRDPDGHVMEIAEKHSVIGAGR